MILTIFSSALNSVQLPVITDDVIVDSNFFIAILAGVILALAFQFILTAISVAAGVTAVGDIKKNYAKSKVEPGGSSVRDEHTFDQDYSSGTSMGVKITTAFGIWSVVTTSIALFGATALALNLNVIESEWTNITTALVIWGLFFLLLFYLEAKIASTLIGNLIAAATSGLRSSANMIGSMFAPSPEKKVENVLGSTIDRIRKEFDNGLNTDKLSKVLDNFLNRVDNKIPDYENLRNDLEGIAKKSRNKNTAGKWMAVQQVLTKMIDENGDSDDNKKKGKAQRLQEVLNTVVSKYKESPGTVDGIKNVVEEFTDMEREQIDRRINDLKDYFSSTSDEGLSKSSLQDKVKEILNDPNVAISMISDNYAKLDRKTVIDLLDNNTNLNREELENYADRISSTVQSVTKEFDRENEKRLVKRMEMQVANFLDSTEREELNFNLLKDDVKKILDDPKDSLEIIKKRFSTFDNNTLRALVTNNRYIKQEHIDTIMDTIENGKKEVMDKVAQIETTAGQQMEIAKRKAIIQAEHARATAASAAWWLVLSTILSGVAAIAGGMVAL